MTDLVPHYLDGARTTAGSTRSGDVCQPATGAVARQVALAEQSGVDLGFPTSDKESA